MTENPQLRETQAIVGSGATPGGNVELVRAIAAALEHDNNKSVVELTETLATPDLADVLELLDTSQCVALVEALGPKFDIEVLSELDEGVRDQLSEALPNEFLAVAAAELDTDDAVYLLENLQESDRQEIIEQLPSEDRAAVERNFEYDEDTAGRLMQSEFVAVAPFWTVGQVIDHLRTAENLPEMFSEILIVDPTYRVLGALGLSQLVRTQRDVVMQDIMSAELHTVVATQDQEEVAREFERYDLISAPVVDENGRLVGVITVDDVVDVIQEEAEEDMRALAGVGDESLADRVASTVGSRLPWLVVNLATAILASLVIKAFDASIEQMVALAVLMPIVASMGGNAGTQTMTVTVRALATNKLGRLNAPRVIMRETIVGIVNGVLLSIIMALVTYVWFGSQMLGLVIAVAMVFNLFCAALAGILIPLLMDWLDKDPAPASGVLVTTVTDVVGFFAFLGLAALWIG